MSESSSGPDALLQLAEEFAERFRRGERPALTEYTDKHPEMAEQIRDLFPAMVVMEEFGSVGGPATGPYGRAGDVSPPVPQQLGEYRILREVARGGMGIVYEAVQESLGRHVALKVLPAQSLLNPHQLERFRREARAAAQLHHTNIVPVFGVGEADGIHYYAMQFIQGQGLDSVLHELRRLRRAVGQVANLSKDSAGCQPAPRQNELSFCIAEGLVSGQFAGNAECRIMNDERKEEAGSSSFIVQHSSLSATIGGHSELTGQSETQFFRSVAHVGVQVADALAYAHQQGILHRDIKPSNLLLDTQGTVWITDFGLAKAEGTDELTSPGDIVGTLRYMAPERFRGEADSRSDVYSLGLSLYELATLAPAFAASERGQLIDKVLHEEPPRPRQVDANMPRDLETIVLKAIAKEPEHRYLSATTLAEDLRRFLADRPIQARRSSWREQTWRWCRRNPAIAALLMLVAVVLLAGTAVSTFFAIQAGDRAAAAVHNAAEADKNATKANDNAQEANTQKTIALESEKTAKANELLARRRLYAAQMNLAHQAWETGQMARVLELLESQRPRPDEEDLRSFEWYYLWRLCHRNWRATLRGKAPLAISPDGQTLASASPDSSVEPFWTDSGVLTLWDLATGTEKAAIKLKAQTALIRLAFTPDGKTLVAASEKGTLHLCDVATAHERAIIQASGRPVRSLALSPDGKIIAAGAVKPSGEGVGLWDTATGKELAFLPGHKGIICVAYSPDGKTVASLAGWGEDFGVKFWDLASKKLRLTVMPGDLDGHIVSCIAFAPDGKTLAKGYVFVDVESGKQRPSHQGHAGKVLGLAYSADGKMFVSGGDDRVVKLSDLATGQTRNLGVHTAQVSDVAVSPDGKTVASGSFDGTIKLWDTGPANEDVAFKSPSRIGCLGFTPDSKGLLVGTGGPTKLLDASTGKEKPSPPRGSVVAISPDANLLASGVAEDKLVIWDVAAARQRAVLPVSVSSFSFSVSSLSAFHGAVFSPDGKTLAMWHFWEPLEETIRLWDIGTQRLRTAISAPGAGSILAAAFSPDGKLLAAACQFRSIKLWDLATGAEKFSVTVGRGDSYMRSVAFSPDSRLVAAGNEHGVVRIWETETTLLRASLKGHTEVVCALAFSRDGKTLATGSRDMSVKLWDVATGQERMTLKGHNAAVLHLAFSSRGHTLASGSEDGTVRLWQAASDPEASARKIELDADDPANPLAKNEAAEKLWRAGRIQEAEEAYRTAILLFEKLAADSPSQPSYRAEIGWTCRKLASLLARQPNRGPEAEEMHRRDLGIFEKLSAEFRDHAAWPEQLAHGHRQWGFDLWETGRPKEGHKALREAINVLEKSTADFPSAVPSHHALLSDTYSRLGTLLKSGGRDKDAENAWREGLAQCEKLAADHPSEGMYLSWMAQFATKLGQFAQAEKAYRNLLALDPKNATAHNNLAWFLATYPDPKLRDPGRALELAKKAVELEPKTGYIVNTLGVAYYRAGEWKAAIETLQNADALDKGRNFSHNAFFLAMAHWKLDQKEEARKWHDQAVQWMEKNAPQDEELRRFRAEAAKLLEIKKNEP